MADYILVRILTYQDNVANCIANYRDKWLPIHLDRTNLEGCDLQEGDYFKWKANKERVVRLEDIRGHPRKPRPEEIQELIDKSKRLETKINEA